MARNLDSKSDRSVSIKLSWCFFSFLFQLSAWLFCFLRKVKARICKITCTISTFYYTRICHLPIELKLHWIPWDFSKLIPFVGRETAPAKRLANSTYAVDGNFKGILTPLYTFFQNGLHLNILLFLFKLALDAAFLSLEFKRIFFLERGIKI